MHQGLSSEIETAPFTQKEDDSIQINVIRRWLSFYMTRRLLADSSRYFTLYKNEVIIDIDFIVAVWQAIITRSIVAGLIWRHPATRCSIHRLE